VRAISAYGYEKLTNTVEINIADRFLVLVFPNPLTDQSVLSIYTSEQSMLNIRIIDITGKLMWRASNVLLSQGSNRLNVPFANWPHGIYLLEASLPSGDKQVLKLIK
jgi:hypothetical protein